METREGREGRDGKERREGGRECYISEKCDQQQFEVKKSQFFFKVPQHFATGGKERIWSNKSYIACVAGVRNGREREFGPKSPFPFLSNACHTG